jgi:hypothetical protein
MAEQTHLVELVPQIFCQQLTHISVNFELGFVFHYKSDQTVVRTLLWVELSTFKLISKCQLLLITDLKGRCRIRR